MLNRELFNRIVELTTPYMDTKSREAYVYSAIFDSRVINRIDWDGSNSVFTIRLIRKLWDYEDFDGITALLTTIKRDVGFDKKTEFDDVLLTIRVIQNTKSQPSQGKDDNLLSPTPKQTSDFSNDLIYKTIPNENSNIRSSDSTTSGNKSGLRGCGTTIILTLFLGVCIVSCCMTMFLIDQNCLWWDIPIIAEILASVGQEPSLGLPACAARYGGF